MDRTAGYRRQVMGQSSPSLRQSSNQIKMVIMYLYHKNDHLGRLGRLAPLSACPL